MNAERRRRAAEILDRLAAEHPDASIALHWSTPLELLVATILSAQSTDVGVNKVTDTLFRRFRTPEDYLAVPVGDLEMLIKPTGFFRQKSAAIRGCCAAILERHGGEVPRTTAELVKLPGVGRKTAAVVASNAFGATEGIAVDTHVRRVSKRLGLTRHSDPDKIERVLMQLYPRTRWLQVSDVLIFHGRRICHARAPRCEECAVTDLCPSAFRVGLKRGQTPKRRRGTSGTVS
ncbi:MAG TPA: endonuclease III [Gaiellales bacterium]|nr:endonuclease III [Gaiellales bacterium]